MPLRKSFQKITNNRKSTHLYKMGFRGSITLKDLNAISLGMGPGSYTGLRIGTASAKGFCFGLNLPLIAVNSLETMVEPFLNKGYDLIIPLLDAKRMRKFIPLLLMGI